MSFARRIINLRFQLGTGAFGEDGSNVVEFSGLRSSANITKAGGVSMSNLELRVWGLPLDVMAKLTVLNQIAQTSARLNTVTVSAGDDESGVSVCFVGTISEAWADPRAMPEVAFHCAAYTGMVDSVRPIAPVSFSGSVDVATVLSGICSQMSPPCTLQNSGVDARIADAYLPGTALDQIRAVARAANINAVMDDGNVLAIWPAGGARDGVIPLISPDTGLVSYPEFTQNGVRLTTLYNPSLTFGQKLQVQSSIKPACGTWVIASVSHNLEAEMPGGQWFTQVECGLLGHEVPIVG